MPGSTDNCRGWDKLIGALLLCIAAAWVVHHNSLHLEEDLASLQAMPIAHLPHVHLQAGLSLADDLHHQHHLMGNAHDESLELRATPVLRGPQNRRLRDISPYAVLDGHASLIDRPPIHNLRSIA